MSSALAAWVVSAVTTALSPAPAAAPPDSPVAPPSGAPAARAAEAPSAHAVRVSFKLDPRLAGPTYGGERWVSPPTYTGASAQDRVEARAQAVDTAGKPTRATFRWTTSAPAVVSVSPAAGGQVTIRALKAGEAKVRVASEHASIELLVRASGAGGALRVEIVQPPSSQSRAAPTARAAGGGAALDRRDLARRNQQRGAALLAANRSSPRITSLPSGVQYEVLAPGTGPSPEDGDTVTCHYRGTRVDGTELASSHRRGRAATVRLDRLVPGLREAVKLMPVGSRWRVFVPPALAYGRRGTAARRGGAPLVGPEETLIYEVELLGIRGTAPVTSFVAAPPARER